MMPSFLKNSLFIFCYWLAWCIVGQLGRIFFLLVQKVPIFWETKASLMLHGLRMDASMAAYITAPLLLWVLLQIWVKQLKDPKWLVWYTRFMFVGVLFIMLCDAFAFKAWGFRLDASVFRYLSNPREVWASVSHLPILGLSVGFVAVLIICVGLFQYFFFRRFQWQDMTWPQSLVGVLFWTVLLVVPLRGGWQLTPINQSSVYFSDNDFVNKAAINAPWNLAQTMLQKPSPKKNPFAYLDPQESQSLSARYFSPLAQSHQVIDTGRPNIIFIIWESFTAKVVGAHLQGKPITPGFNQLSNQGLYFSNLYAAGDRTDKGVVALLSGYPAQPINSIVKDAAKAAKLPSVQQVLAQAGYQSAYYYGGELEFANIKSYLLSSGFRQFVTINQFEKKEQNSKWGAHDGVVAQRLLAALPALKQPFFYTWQTLSSHEPYEVPVETVFNGQTDEIKFLNSLHYSDSVIYSFVEACKTLPCWKNTLLIICADHGHRFPAAINPSEDFRIPVLIMGGALKQLPETIQRIGSQIDLLPSLLQQLNLPYAQFVWSRNLFSPLQPPGAYFCYNNGFGLVQSKGKYLFENVGRRVTWQQGVVELSDIQLGKAIQQTTYLDYLQK